jgi:predicted membrane chloride channel (bestrophin family)
METSPKQHIASRRRPRIQTRAVQTSWLIFAKVIAVTTASDAFMFAPNRIMTRTPKSVHQFRPTSSLQFDGTNDNQGDALFGQPDKVQGRVLSDAVYDSNLLNDHRYSASDWLHNFYSIPRSAILRDMQPPLTTIFFWSVSVSIVHKLLKIFYPAAASFICISSTPHSFLVSALGLLLVFRTNSAYQRFAEGRKIWEQILSVSRNLSRLTNLYEDDITTKRKHRVFRLLGVFPYLLHHHIIEEKRPSKHSNGQPMSGLGGFGQNLSPLVEAVDETSLPWSLLPRRTRAKCLESDNPPMWVCDRLSQEFTNVEYNPNFTSRERFTFLSHVSKLSKSVGECERIHQTSVPQNYARHSLRSLTIWLVTLPFALIKELGLLTGPVMGVTAWLMLGVYQIGTTIEDPFQGSLRLRMLCDAIYRDVMYGYDTTNPRETAYKMDKAEGREWNELGPILPMESALNKTGSSFDDEMKP